MLKIACLFSGGKDSTYALHWAVLQGFEVECLVTLKPLRRDSWMFHRPCIELAKLQSKALGIPIIFMETKGEKERELEDLKLALKKAIEIYNVNGVVAGALLSDYQRMRIAITCEELGLKTYTPIWRRNQEDYMREIVEIGFKVMITSVSCYGLPTSLVGKVISREIIEDIIRRARKYGFNPAFEGGEAETLVLDAPLFKKKLAVRGRVRIVSDFEAHYVVEDAYLGDKEFNS